MSNSDRLSWIVLGRLQQALVPYLEARIPSAFQGCSPFEEALLMVHIQQLLRDLLALRRQMRGDIMSDSLVLLDAYELVMVAYDRTCPGCAFVSPETIDEGDSDPVAVLNRIISIIRLLIIDLGGSPDNED